MITLSQPSNSKQTNVADIKRPTEVVETAGSLAMLFENGLMTMGQYDEYISNNPFAVDYSMYSTYEGNDSAVAWDGFLGSFSNALSTLGSASAGMSEGFSSGFSGSSSGGGFTSFC